MMHHTTRNFRCSITDRDISTALAKQLNNMIPDSIEVSGTDLQPYVIQAFEKTYRCFTGINSKYYNDGNEVFFNHLHSDHYCSFLYLVSHAAYLEKATDLATKLFLLNKYLHGLDLYFSVALPEVFLLVHPVGSVIGNAQYGNKIVFYQNCTVGSVYKEGSYIYPKFGDNVVLYAKAMVLGECTIGNNVILGANSFAIKAAIPDHSIVTGTSPNLTIKQQPFVKIHFFR